VVVAESYEDTIKIKEENAKLKKELQELAKHNTIVIESLDEDKKLAYENKLLKEENQYLKLGLMYDKQEEDESVMLEELASNNDPIIKKLTQENRKLKKEKEHLTKGVSKFHKRKGPSK